MAFPKKVTKSPAVMVETKKLSKDNCCLGSCGTIKDIIVIVLVFINTVMLGWILFNQVRIEADRVGGRANYKMVQKIYKLDTFKNQQKQQIEQALQMYQQNPTQQAVQQQLPTTVQANQ